MELSKLAQSVVISLGSSSLPIVQKKPFYLERFRFSKNFLNRKESIPEQYRLI